MARSPTVVKATASSVSVRMVATWVPGRMWIRSGCGPLSQKVTATRAAVGGKRRTPSSSRNFT